MFRFKFSIKVFSKLWPTIRSSLNTKGRVAKYKSTRNNYVLFLLFFPQFLFVNSLSTVFVSFMFTFHTIYFSYLQVISFIFQKLLKYECKEFHIKKFNHK